MERSIQQVARLAGTTSRTLRHYEAVGLLVPARVGGNGYRYYGEAELRRLQRILLLRELGLGLPQIGEILDGAVSDESALAAHAGWLRQEQERIARQLASIEATIRAIEQGEELMAETMFDGFDHTAYREEVEARWGRAAYADGDAWWRTRSDDERAAWKQRSDALARDWIAAAERGESPSGAEAQALAQRHVEWLRGIPGTPAAAGGDIRDYVLGLAEMYVADPRFAANYATSDGGARGAEFVRDALRISQQSAGTGEPATLVDR